MTHDYADFCKREITYEDIQKMRKRMQGEMDISKNRFNEAQKWLDDIKGRYQDCTVKEHYETIRHALTEMQKLTAQNKLLAEEVARLKEFIGLETAYDVNDPAMNAARYDGYLDGIQVGMATQITGEKS